MTAFIPISPAAARQVLCGISEVDDYLFLSAFVEAGRVRAYADVIETLTWNGGRTEALDSRIPPTLWRRIVGEGKLAEVLASSSTRLDGDGLIGGRPAVMITGVRFNAENVRKIADKHSAMLNKVDLAPAAKPKPIKSVPKSITPDKPTSTTDAPPLIKPVESSASERVKSVVRVGLPDDVLCVTVPEAESILGVSRSQIYRMFDSGALEKVKVGGRTLVKAHAIRKLLGSTG